jgi:hypothetical protein
MRVAYFFLCLLLLLIGPALMVVLMLTAIVGSRDNRKYLEHETERYEERVAEADLPSEPYE